MPPRPFVGAMKIARNVAVSGWYDEWPPPSVGAMKIARNVAAFGRYDEWHPPSVGAMKIARNVAVSGRCVEWYSRSHSTGYSLISGVSGDFHRPYGGAENLPLPC